MSNLSYPKSTGKENNKEREQDYKGPSIPKFIADVKELTQELFLHPAERPLFNAPVFRVRV
jgi:hypothetical protein